jgi:hypothetical protein
MKLCNRCNNIIPLKKLFDPLDGGFLDYEAELQDERAGKQVYRPPKMPFFQEGSRFLFSITFATRILRIDLEPYITILKTSTNMPRRVNYVKSSRE